MTRPFEHIAAHYLEQFIENERAWREALKDAGLVEGVLVSYPCSNGDREIWKVTEMMLYRGVLHARGRRQLKRGGFSQNEQAIGLVRDLHLAGEVLPF